ncbi:class E sortase [Streptomyces sp. NBC_00893]|uniref:class E sortase n=1 Tax=Streptomyces sp. NBC_00893 TaxID=2975862 RepID=UPI00224EFC59|nr:class E sortase [Streptomyces sp. NBC_00893]MCX4847800.1 class E sortase [Streptomyces sp. NBC_00893]
MRERIPVVVQRNSRGRRVVARGLWTGAELVVTLGVVLLLLVVHQLWWTNRQARAGAEHQVRALQREWGEERGGTGAVPGGGPGGGSNEAGRGGGDGRGGGGGDQPDRGGAARSAPRWDQAYAVIRIPRLGLVAPVAQGIGKSGVLDKGYVGHYPGTAQPGRPGNFALAGHRNTHGEPFRYINRLRRGDRIDVETRDAVYTYTVDRTLARTTPHDGGVIAAVPRSNVKPYIGYTEAGSYVTLTTCTPEFTSRYRLVVWGRLVDVRSR